MRSVSALQSSRGRLSVTRGYSLPELMTVVALVAVVGSLAVGHFGKPSRAVSAAGVARDAYTRLVQARTAAATSGGLVAVCLFPGDLDHLLWLRPATTPGMNTDAPLADPQDEVPARRALHIVAVSPTIDTTGVPPPQQPPGEQRIVFFPDGRAQLGGAPPHPGVTIYFTDDLGRANYRLTVLGRTGFTRLHER